MDAAFVCSGRAGSVVRGAESAAVGLPVAVLGYRSMGRVLEVVRFLLILLEAGALCSVVQGERARSPRPLNCPPESLVIQAI